MISHCLESAASVKSLAAPQAQPQPQLKSPHSLSYATVCTAAAATTNTTTTATTDRRAVDGKGEPRVDEGEYEIMNQGARVVRNACNSRLTLLCTVLGWKVQDFSNASLLQNLVRIPVEFESSQQWYETFYPFVVEEVRAQLHQVSDKGYKDAVTYEATVIEKKRPESDALLLDLYVLVPRGSDQEKLLTESPHTLGVFVKNVGNKSRSLSGERLLSSEHVLVNLEYTPSEDDPIHSRVALMEPSSHKSIFNAVVRNSSLSQELLASGAKGWDFYMIWVGTLSAQRISDALFRSEDPTTLMGDVVHGSPQRLSGRALVVNSKTVDRSSASRPFTHHLNESQTQTIDSILCVSAEDSDEPAVQLIKGPPGN